MQITHRLIISALVSGLLSASASAGVTIEGTRVVVDGSQKRDTSVRVRNEGSSPAMIQAWIDAGDSAVASEADAIPFRITPAGTPVLKPGAGQAFRITYAPRPSEALPLHRESVLYFNLLDVPPMPDETKQNMLQFAVRSRIKLFYRPPGLVGSASEAAAALEWSVHQDVGRRWLQVVNPSAYHVTLASVLAPGETDLPKNMIEPRETMQIPINSGAPLPERVTFNWIDDYGAAREHHAQITRAQPRTEKLTFIAGNCCWKLP